MRVWKYIPFVVRILKESLSISTQMVKVTEYDGAVPWQILMHHVRGLETEEHVWRMIRTKSGSFIVSTEKATKMPHGLNVRSFRRTTNRSKAAKQRAPAPYGWTDYFDHVGSTHDCRSVPEGVLYCRWNRSSRGTTDVLHCRRDPMEVSMVTPRHEPKEPGKKPYTLRCRLTHSAAHWFDLRFVQHEGLVFWQTITDAIMLYDSMPAVIICEYKKFACVLTFKEVNGRRPQKSCDEQQTFTCTPQWTQNSHAKYGRVSWTIARFLCEIALSAS